MSGTDTWSSAIHEIATNGETIIPLDEDGIDNPCGTSILALTLIPLLGINKHSKHLAAFGRGKGRKRTSLHNTD